MATPEIFRSSLPPLPEIRSSVTQESVTPMALSDSCAMAERAVGANIEEKIAHIKDQDPLTAPFMQATSFSALPWLSLRHPS